MFVRAVLLAVSVLLILDTLFVQTISNPNLGVYLPALLGVPLLLIGLFYRPCLLFFSKGFGRMVKGVLIGGYALFFAGFAVVCGLLVAFGTAAPDGGAEAVVVLGAGLKNGRPSATLARRLDKAMEYLEENPDTLVVVTGGIGSGQSISEGAAMERYLLDKGLEKGRILREETSTSTLENLQNAKDLLETEAGFVEGEYRVVVVSSDFHVFRALRVADRAGLEAEGLGSPSLWYLTPNFYLREYVAVAGYWMLGRL